MQNKLPTFACVNGIVTQKQKPLETRCRRRLCVMTPNILTTVSTF
jgi:hypothetical protein